MPRKDFGDILVPLINKTSMAKEKKSRGVEGLYFANDMMPISDKIGIKSHISYLPFQLSLNLP